MEKGSGLWDYLFFFFICDTPTFVNGWVFLFLLPVL